MFEAVIRYQAFDHNGNVVEITFGETCGHLHRDIRDAAMCVNSLADKVGLKLYESCIIRALDNEPVSLADRMLLYGIFERNRKQIQQ